MFNYDYGMMSGSYGSGMMAFGWLITLLVIINLTLGAIALWKYINTK